MGYPAEHYSRLIYLRRTSDTPEGVAAGVGLTLVTVRDLPAGIEALSDRRLLVVRDAGHPSTNLRRACAAIARATCAPAYAPGVALELYEFLRMGID